MQVRRPDDTPAGDGCGGGEEKSPKGVLGVVVCVRGNEFDKKKKSAKNERKGQREGVGEHNQHIIQALFKNHQHGPVGGETPPFGLRFWFITCTNVE